MKIGFRDVVRVSEVVVDTGAPRRGVHESPPDAASPPQGMRGRYWRGLTRGAACVTRTHDPRILANYNFRCHPK